MVDEVFCENNRCKVDKVLFFKLFRIDRGLLFELSSEAVGGHRKEAAPYNSLAS